MMCNININFIKSLVEALLKDESKTARVQVSTKPIVTVFTAAGKQLGQMRVL